MHTLYHGDCLDILPTLPAQSVDTIITDPPAGISFMGKSWDSDKGGRDQWISWLTLVMREALRVTKPGGMALVWSIPRTSHWTGTAIERAGWEVRDVVTHLFGSGFPKSHQFAKQMNGHGAEWQGYGTALKPAAEFWWLAMKPLDGTFADNALRWGVAGLNVDKCRIGTDETWSFGERQFAGKRGGIMGETVPRQPSQSNPAGRWPANLILDEESAAALDQASGVSKSTGGRIGNKAGGIAVPGGRWEKGDPGFGDTGGASRFFYVAKASRRERNEGLEGMEARYQLRNDLTPEYFEPIGGGAGVSTINAHPT